MEGDNQVINIIEKCDIFSGFGEEKLILSVNSKEKFDRNVAFQVKFNCFFGLCVVISLCVVEIACNAFINTWNDEVFTTITGLVGVIIRFLVFRKTKR